MRDGDVAKFPYPSKALLLSAACSSLSSMGVALARNFAIEGLWGRSNITRILMLMPERVFLQINLRVESLRRLRRIWRRFLCLQLMWKIIKRSFCGKFFIFSYLHSHFLLARSLALSILQKTIIFHDNLFQMLCCSILPAALPGPSGWIPS